MLAGFNEKEISDFFHNIIGQNKKFNQQKINESILFVRASQALEKILPKTLLDHINIFRYKAGVLYLNVDHGIYAQQLQLQQDEIVKKLQKMTGIHINKLHVQVGKTFTKPIKNSDIMSQSEKLSRQSMIGQESHENADLINSMIMELKKKT